MILLMEKEVVNGREREGPVFRFEAGWVKEKNCAVIVENAWKLSMLRARVQ